MEESLFLSVILVWIPAVFILTMSIVSIFEDVGIRRLLCLYVAMLSGPFVGACIGGAMDFFVGEIAGLFSGLLSGGAVGALAGMISCDLPTKEEHVFKFKWLVFLIGAAVGGFTGMFAGVLASSQNYRAVVTYFLFLLIAELVSFVFALFVRFVRNFIKTFRVMSGWY